MQKPQFGRMESYNALMQDPPVKFSGNTNSPSDRMIDMRQVSGESANATPQLENSFYHQFPVKTGSFAKQRDA